MNDGDGCGLLFAILTLLVIVGIGTCSEGRVQGRVLGACAVRIEYTKTAADTLAILRNYPECTEQLSGKATK